MSNIVEAYRDIMYNKNDPRTKDWFLVTGPGPIIMIVVSYIYFSVSAGPRFMRDKKPYELKNILIVYNFIQIVMSTYMVKEALIAGWLYDYNLTCQPVDRSLNPNAIRYAHGVYIYFICKLIELLDTVFFVLRKKNSQITFLHIYHHALMPITAFVGVRWFPGGHVTMVGFINCFVHIFMYAYYMLAAMGPQVQKYLWWKKYLTLLQIVQFVIILIHNGQTFLNGCEAYPKFIAGLLFCNTSFFIYLFSSFYYHTYMKADRRRAKKMAAQAEGADVCRDKATSDASNKLD